jgi:hypothetical protein
MECTLPWRSASAPVSSALVQTGKLRPHFGRAVVPTRDPMHSTLKRGSLHPGFIGGGGGGGGASFGGHTTQHDSDSDWRLMSTRLSMSGPIGAPSGGDTAGSLSPRATQWREPLPHTPHRRVEHVWYQPVHRRGPSTPLFRRSQSWKLVAARTETEDDDESALPDISPRSQPNSSHIVVE